MARPPRTRAAAKVVAACGEGGEGEASCSPRPPPHAASSSSRARSSSTSSSNHRKGRGKATAIMLMMCGAAVAVGAAALLPTAAAGRSLSSAAERGDGRAATSSGSGSSSSSSRLEQRAHPLIPSAAAAGLRLAAPALKEESSSKGGGAFPLPSLFGGGRTAATPSLPPLRPPSFPSLSSPLAPMKEPKDPKREKTRHSRQKDKQARAEAEAQAKTEAQRAQAAALLPAGTPQWATNLLRTSVNASWSDSMADLVLPYGYPLQTFNITTRDGYVLTVYRIPHGGRGAAAPPLEVWPSGMDPAGAAAQLHAALRSAVSNATSMLTGGLLTLESGQVSGPTSNATAAAELVEAATTSAAAAGGGGAAAALASASAPAAPTNPSPPGRLRSMIGGVGDGIESAGGKVADWTKAGLRPVTATIQKVAGGGGGKDAALAAAAKAALAKPKPIAMLIHGLSVSSAGWVVLGPDDSLAFKLADAGYDVWMPNTRGSLYSQRHVTLQPNEREFWAYSLDEQAVVDLPAFIDLALNVTGASTVTLFGHSQGGILEIMTLAARPEYNAKVDLAVGLAPVYFPALIATPLIRFMLNLEMYKLLGILTAAGVQDVVPNWMIGRLLGAPQCSNGLMDVAPCLALIHTTLAGKYGFISPGDFDAITRTWPASVGLRNLLHWVEIAKEARKNNTIVSYPCGDDCAKCADSPVALGSCRSRLALTRRAASRSAGDGNGGDGASANGGGGANAINANAGLRVAAPAIPAEYDLSLITTKIAVLGGDLDLLAPPESYRLLKERVAPGAFVEYDASGSAGHMDVTWGRDAPWYAASVAMMQRHTKGVPQPGVMGGKGLGAFDRIAGAGGWTATGGAVEVEEAAADEGSLAAAAAGRRRGRQQQQQQQQQQAAAAAASGSKKRMAGMMMGGLFGLGGGGGGSGSRWGKMMGRR